MTEEGTAGRMDGLPRRMVVRPYVLTRGRTTSALGALAMHAPVLATVTPEQLGRTGTPEDRRIIELCQTPTSVAELAARLETPVGVVRVLVDTRRIEDCFPAVDYFEHLGIPFVVAVNLFNGVYRHHPREVREALSVPANVPVVLCDARNRLHVKETLVLLVEGALRRAQMAGATA